MWEEIKEPSCDVDNLTEADLKKLQPLLWLELASLFDKNHVSLDKRKPFKRKRKEGNFLKFHLQRAYLASIKNF